MHFPKKAFWLRLFWMTLGTVVMAIGIYFFKVPNGFSTGGVSGIGTLLGKATSISTATWIAGINILMLLLGLLFLGWKMTANTVYCSLLLSALLGGLEYLYPMNAPLTDQPFMELVIGILLTAIGAAVIFQADASSGGTDILALILKKYSHLDVGKALLCVDALIALSAFFVFDVRTGLFSLLGLFGKAFLVDRIIETIDSCKYFIVITDHGEEVEAYILEQLHHGVTTHPVEGGYTGRERTMIHTVCRRLEAFRLRAQIRKIDPDSFIIISNTDQIIGRGFRAV